MTRASPGSDAANTGNRVNCSRSAIRLRAMETERQLDFAAAEADWLKYRELAPDKDSVREAYLLEREQGASTPFARAHAPVDERQLDIFERGRASLLQVRERDV